jgi:hypothetical protein
MPNNQLALLVGNGLSITANPELSIPSLTRDISERFAKIDPKREAPDRVLARLAKRARETGDPYKDFEAMIGPLDQQRESLDDLKQLSELVGETSRPVRQAITTIDTFVKSLRRLGVGHALDIIASKSVAHALHLYKVEKFINSAVSVADGSAVAIGNLNYDALVMAALCRTFPDDFCDMAWGYKNGDFDLHGDGGEYCGALLRTEANQFPLGKTVRLVHLHGSLAWLRDPKTGLVYRFSIEDLRNSDHWAAWRDGSTEWEPQVVLTNQSAKNGVVQNEPFKLAYDVFYERLLNADRWLIAGYSFRDECVNDLLVDAWRNRDSCPEILVITLGKELKRTEILEAIGYDTLAGDPTTDDFLHVCRHGIEAAPTCPTWKRWGAFGGGSTTIQATA